jgi:hypothetical protein
VRAETRLAKATDYQISACSKWTAPDGARFLELPFVVPFYQLVTAGQVLNGVEVACSSEFDFLAKVLSSTTTVAGALVQVQWPGGRYLSSSGLSVFDFLGTGMRGRLIDEHELISRGDKVRLNIDASAAVADVNLSLFFEGVLRLPMVPNV